jgi:hypothetical protein
MAQQTIPAEWAELARKAALTDEMLTALEKSEQRIKQLCETVNTYSNMLNLGDKVKTEHFTDTTRAAIAKAKGGAL